MPYLRIFNCCSVAKSCLTWTAAHQAPLSFTTFQNLLKFMSVMPSNHLILCYPLLLPSIFPSIRIFLNELALQLRWPEYWSFSSQHQFIQWIFRLISIRMDWFNLLAVQGTLKSLDQHHSLKALILQCSAFFMVHLSYLYMTTGKTIALTILTLIDQVMSLLFNTVSRFVIAFQGAGVF